MQNQNQNQNQMTTRKLSPFMGRPRTLIHDPSDIATPWRIAGLGSAWYFKTEAEAMAHYEAERAPRRRRKARV